VTGELEAFVRLVDLEPLIERRRAGEIDDYEFAEQILRLPRVTADADDLPPSVEERLAELETQLRRVRAALGAQGISIVDPTEQPYACPRCRQDHESAEDLYQHYRVKHRDIHPGEIAAWDQFVASLPDDPEADVWICSVCDLDTGSQRGLALHGARHPHHKMARVTATWPGDVT
jgi:hypothetical protein